LLLKVQAEHYPFWARRLLGMDLALREVRMLAAGAGLVELGNNDSAIGDFARHLSDNTMKDLWLALKFGQPARATSSRPTGSGSEGSVVDLVEGLLAQDLLRHDG
jgi:hypothetical protein